MALFNIRHACICLLFLFSFHIVFAIPVPTRDLELKTVATRETSSNWGFVHPTLTGHREEAYDKKPANNEQDINHLHLPCREHDHNNKPCAPEGPLGCAPPTPNDHHQCPNQQLSTLPGPERKRITCWSHDVYQLFIKNGVKPEGCDVISPGSTLTSVADSRNYGATGSLRDVDRLLAPVLVLLVIMLLAVLTVGIIDAVEFVWERWRGCHQEHGRDIKEGL